MHRQLSVVLSFSVAMVVTACNSSTTPTSPSAPPTAEVSPAPIPQPQSTYTLSGVVFEVTPTGQAPVEGVQLYCDSCGSPTGHTDTSTDANGFYSFSWTRNGVTPLVIWKTGYDVLDPTGFLVDGTAVKHATVSGDTKFDILIVRR